MLEIFGEIPESHDFDGTIDIDIVGTYSAGTATILFRWDPFYHFKNRKRGQKKPRGGKRLRRKWFLKAIDAESNCESVSVGGLAHDLGMLKNG